LVRHGRSGGPLTRVMFTSIEPVARMKPIMLAASQSLFPKATLLQGVRRAFFALKFLFYTRPCSALLKRGAREFQKTLSARPDVLGVVEWPYIHKAWGPARRVQAICEHYGQIEAHPWLHIPINSRLLLMDLGDVCEGLSLQVERPKWFIREGELTISLFLKDTRLYSICFAMGLRGCEVVAYVGGIQGRSIEAAKEQYSELTKQLHGTRPRDFLIIVAGLVTSRLGAHQMYGVCDENRHHRHPYFQGYLDGGRSTCVYDEIWSDRGGQLTEDGFMRMQVPFERRPLEEVSSKKRAMYRRRYELFDLVDQRIDVVIAQGRQAAPGATGSELVLLSGTTF
jgi:uncharacterized protein